MSEEIKFSFLISVIMHFYTFLVSIKIDSGVMYLSHNEK